MLDDRGLFSPHEGAICSDRKHDHGATDSRHGRVRPLMLLLPLLLTPATAFPQLNEEAAGVGRRYIAAVGVRDLKTIIDLSYSNQDEIATIKAQNPQILWPKLIKEYYDARTSPVPKTLSIAGLDLTNAKWSISETRTSHVEDSIQFGPYDRTVVYVLVDYPSVKDAAYIGGKFLKETILQFEINSKSQLVMGAERLPQGDTPFDKIPFMIMNAFWNAEGLGGLRFSAQTVGGTPPFQWNVQCGGQDMRKLNSASVSADPTSGRVFVELRARFPDGSFPLQCLLDVKDGAGQADTVGVTVPKMFTGLLDGYCWVRAPYLDRNQGLPNMGNGKCLGPVLPMDTAPKSLPPSNPPPPAQSGPPTTETRAPTAAPGAQCADFDSCNRAVSESLKSSAWQKAIAEAKLALSFNPASGIPWAAIGSAYLGSGQSDQLASAWDKVLQTGQTLSVVVCHKLGGAVMRRCEQGTLSLNASQVSFSASAGQTLFTAPPARVKVRGVMNNSVVAVFTWQVDGKNFEMQFVPLGVECSAQGLLSCGPAGVAQQAAVATYLSQTIPKLAAGAFGQPAKP